MDFSVNESWHTCNRCVGRLTHLHNKCQIWGNLKVCCLSVKNNLCNCHGYSFTFKNNDFHPYGTYNVEI